MSAPTLRRLLTVVGGLAAVVMVVPRAVAQTDPPVEAAPAEAPADAPAEPEPTEAPVDEDAPAGGAPAGLSQAERYAWEGGQLLDKGSLNAAEAKIGLALTIDDKAAGAHFQLARLKLHKGSVPEAWAATKTCTAVAPRHAPCWVLQLRLAAPQRMADGVLKDVERVANQARDDLALQIALAEGQLLTGQHPAAQRTATAVLKKAETSVAAMKILARTYLALGKDATAESIIDRVLELDKDAEALVLLSGILMNRGKLLEARGRLEQAIAAQPGNLEALNNLGVVYNRVRNHEAAMDVLGRAVAAAPAFAYAHLNLGSAQRGAGRFDDAEASWKKALALDPRLWDAWYNLGILYLENRLPGREREAQLNAAIEAFNTYKREANPRGADLADVDKFIGEAKLLIEQEQQRKQEELKSADPAPAEAPPSEDPPGDEPPTAPPDEAFDGAPTDAAPAAPAPAEEGDGV